MSEDAKKITVYYDGACPQCIRDRRHYEKLAGKYREQIRWFDITGREEHLRELGIDPHKALTELHVRDEQGRILSELEAYRLLLRRIPLLRPLAWFLGFPILRPWLARLYRARVLRRLRNSGRL
jgi:predicted DCC family thiol-disulfide oxidoreductase YuxK